MDDGVAHRFAPLLDPLNKPLVAYLKTCSRIVMIGCDPDLCRAFERQAAGKLEVVGDVLEAELAPDSDEAACLLVASDVLDADAPYRVRQVRAIYPRRPDLYLFGITSFMPGAYRDFIRQHGADDCILAPSFE